MSTYKATITSEDGTEDHVMVHLEETRDGWRGTFGLGRRIPVAAGPQSAPSRLKFDEGRSGNIHIVSVEGSATLFFHVFIGTGPLE